eukprot:scaffold233329_cov49-Attheya_sp.AAC.1
MLYNTPVALESRTSGARVSVIERISPEELDSENCCPYKEIHSDSIPWTDAMPYDAAPSWIYAIDTLLSRASSSSVLLSTVKSICVSGTSASCLMIDSHKAGEVTRSPRMYDYDIIRRSESTTYGIKAKELLERFAPARHTAQAPTGSLAKLLCWNEEKRIESGEVLCHQSDYVSMYLMNNGKKCGSGRAEMNRIVFSDWHNCLKCGYDVRNLEWPSWLVDCLEHAGVNDPVGRGVIPPQVVSPGQPMGTIAQDISRKFGLPEGVTIVGGTTDSNAAFFAAIGGTQPEFGTAVTSLGSTLAIKQLSRTFVEDADRGVYSHRFPLFGDKSTSDSSTGENEAWLIGGASNVGCAVLRQKEFSNDELKELSRKIDPDQDSPLLYYPLTKKGERFPTADSGREPLMEPVPPNRQEYLHGILQGISDVERDGFLALGQLGASPESPSIVWSCGGGAQNEMWMKMRERRISGICSNGAKVVVRRAPNTEASFGAAILAAATFH